MILFDDQLRAYSTCRDCGQHMRVINYGQTSHPTCEPKPTKLETLAAGWLSTVLAGDAHAEELTAEEITEQDSRPPQLRRAAITYAQWGWPVFPLKTADKTPATKNGFKDATTNVSEIAQWWTENPDHNIGLATGHKFDVYDIDPPTGIYSFLKLLQQNRLPDTHGIVTTASGGTHMYIKPTGKGNYANLKPGIDYRGQGGYVVAPPSTLGQRWRSWSWLIAPSPAIKHG